MPAECVQVMVRCRPMSKKELTAKNQTCVDIDSATNQITLSKPDEADNQQAFTFDAVFSDQSSQISIYETSAFGLVEAAFEGYNGTMFAYGQTGCGKTHTMMGDPQSEDGKGIIPRTFSHIMGVIEGENQKQFLIRCSFIEIYNEDIHDLLSKDVKAKYELKQSPDKGIFIKDLNKLTVKSVREMEQYMQRGNQNRSTGETAMNKDSSRSHSIFTIYIETSEEIEKGKQRIIAGKLNMVDLAGSERQSKTQATGERLQEANKINLSLSALGNVISALVDGKIHHIPYRDSKLTRLLQDSLGGNTKTIMMAAVSPADYNYDETLGTLRYASRAKNIKNQPQVNEDPQDALLKEYAEEIKRLKEMLLKNQGNGGVNGGGMLNNDPRGQGLGDGSGSQMTDTNDTHQAQDDENDGHNQNGGTSSSQQNLKLTSSVIQKSQELNKIKQEHEKINKDKERLEVQLKEREEEFQKERVEREEIQKKLKELEQLRIVGGKGDEQEKKKQAEIRKKLKQQLKVQEKLLNENKKKQEQFMNIQKNYQNLQQEVDDLRQLAKKLQVQNKQSQNEVKDLEHQHEEEKEQLLDSIRELDRENQLNQAIIQMLLSTEQYELVQSQAEWIDEKNLYLVPAFFFKEKSLQFPKILKQNNSSGNDLGDFNESFPTNQFNETKFDSFGGFQSNSQQESMQDRGRRVAKETHQRYEVVSQNARFGTNPAHPVITNTRYNSSNHTHNQNDDPEFNQSGKAPRQVNGVILDPLNHQHNNSLAQIIEKQNAGDLVNEVRKVQKNVPLKPIATAGGKGSANLQNNQSADMTTK